MVPARYCQLFTVTNFVLVALLYYIRSGRRPMTVVPLASWSVALAGGRVVN